MILILTNQRNLNEILTNTDISTNLSGIRLNNKFKKGGGELF